MALLDNARQQWENLSDRERKLTTLLGASVGAFLVFLVFLFSTTVIWNIEDENEEIASVLRDIARNDAKLRAQAEAREKAKRRYERLAPPLATFVDAEARAQGLTINSTSDQPEKVANGFKRRNVRVEMNGVTLRPVIQMLSKIDQSEYPVGIERVQIDHFQSGDRYNVKLGVIAYDRQRRASTGDGAAPAAGSAGTSTASRVSGPPAP